jgi:hypothetical protein
MSLSKEKLTVEVGSASQSVLEKPQRLESLEAGSKFTPAETKRLLRKMDWNLVPFLALLYL